MTTILRWSVWGHCGPSYSTMLAHSVASFRHFFRDRVRYVVFAPQPDKLRHSIGKLAEVRPLHATSSSPFNEPHGTWQKWAPCPRLSKRATELRIDADMFLLREPLELYDFCFTNRGRWSYVVALEEFAAAWPYGNFVNRVRGAFPHINAGILGQYRGHDISRLLRNQQTWWRASVPRALRLYHDEQGAVRSALSMSSNAAKILFLPWKRYRVICPLNRRAISEDKDLVLLHATYPRHPAFRWLRGRIEEITGDVIGEYSPELRKRRDRRTAIAGISVKRK